MTTRRQFLLWLADLAIRRGTRTENMAYKCIAGVVTPQQRVAAGASYFYWWDNPADNPTYNQRQIPCFKGTESSGPFTGSYTNAAAIRDAASRNQWIICGNEWLRAGWSTEKQLYWLKWFIDQVRSVNARCRIIATNDVIYEPDRYPKERGFYNLNTLVNRYKQLYGTVPPIDVGFHCYKFPGMPDYARYMYDYHAAAAKLFRERPSTKLILTEWGSEISQEYAISAIGDMKRLLPYGRIYAHFFFVSYEPGKVCNIFTTQSGTGLTAVGQAFKRL